MVTDEDDPDDSDYNSVDVERDAQEDDEDDAGKPMPKPKVPPLTSGLTSFEAISRQGGSVSKKSSTETWDTTIKITLAFSNGHPSLLDFNGRQPMRSRSNDAKNYTTKGMGF
jgi:hypothetical protein